MWKPLLQKGSLDAKVYSYEGSGGGPQRLLYGFFVSFLRLNKLFEQPFGVPLDFPWDFPWDIPWEFRWDFQDDMTGRDRTEDRTWDRTGQRT